MAEDRALLQAESFFAGFFTDRHGDPLAALPRALRRSPGRGVWYQDRSPTEGELEGAVEVFVVLREPYEPFEETDDVTRIAYEVMDETDWDLHVIPHHDSVAGPRAEWAEKKGGEL
jgi:hypothetical protein